MTWVNAEDQTEEQVIEALYASLSPDILHPDTHLPVGAHPHAGHCYTVCEALYHLFPGRYTPHQGRPRNLTSHWWLVEKETGRVVDPTSAQFDFPVDYSAGCGHGFQTTYPSKRTQVLMARVSNYLRPFTP
jgi:hypothetical protein